MLRCRDQVRYGASIARRLQLFVYDLDLLVEHFPGKPVDRHLHPVTLLTFHNGTYKTRSVGRIAAAQGYHVNQ